MKNLNIPQKENPSVKADHIEDPVLKSIETFKNHQSLKLIKACFLNNITFSFDEITIFDVEKELKNLDSSIAAHESNIPAKKISRLKQVNFHLKSSHQM